MKIMFNSLISNDIYINDELNQQKRDSKQNEICYFQKELSKKIAKLDLNYLIFFIFLFSQ